MAISPPSDIVLDVARAADPSSVATARTELMRRTQPATAAGFDAGLTAATAGSGQVLGREAEPATAAGAAKKFEAMVLETFISSMMPKNAESTYGKGLAGDMWKSMMAQKIAGVVAERGGIGIADRVLGDFEMKGEVKKSVAGIDSRSGDLGATHSSMVANSVVDQIQRRFAKNLDVTAAASSGGLFDK
ncbi:MAG: rod-binding protein [Rhizobiales bacterium]|nr:rod-binding protein [Hyphomicrobiales bacterium]